MFVSVLLLTLGCALRVPCEIVAYEAHGNWAWSVLPVSAVLELAGITAFAVNMLGTLILEPCHFHKQPVIVRGIGQPGDSAI